MIVNQTTRDMAIDVIVRNYIGQEGDEIGMLIDSVNFGELYKAVNNLRTYGRGKNWRKAITRWEDTIEMCRKAFMDENGFSCLEMPGSERDYTMETSRDLIRKFKHAVMLGATFAYIGNR